ncbi:MAG TPA: hypothetical protein PKH79_13870, partial [Prolixibacteraceae bacterium]|nr:hypothetical protein [Prolixibacteraceae bacterium]
MKRFSLLFFILFFVFAGNAKTTLVSFNDPNISYEGRINYRPDAAELSWPGTSVTIQFEGTSVSAILQDLDTANYYNVIVDNQVVSKIHTEMQKKTYQLASGLTPGKHTAELF